MKVAVTGSSGLVGQSLLDFLSSKGAQVIRLVRGAASTDPTTVDWDPESGLREPARLQGIEAVVHLAGESIAARRWNEAQKQRIRDSRIHGTRALVNTVIGLTAPPKAFICASAIGYYGDRGDELLTEDSRSGSGFLADVCRSWEAAAEPAARQGIRVVNLRFGVILSPRGGALAKMLTPFRLGAGGRVGDGQQYMSWVALDDVTSAVHHAIVNPALRGPVNVVAPNAVTNAEFTRVLANVLNRPALFPMPAFAVKALFGEMGEALLLAGQRVEPVRLRESGFRFAYPDLEGALRHLLSRTV
jgi:uncharacterized protein (TIGR01777 family)